MRIANVTAKGKTKRMLRFVQSEFQDRKRQERLGIPQSAKRSPVQPDPPVERKRDVKAQEKMDDWDSRFNSVVVNASKSKAQQKQTSAKPTDVAAKAFSTQSTSASQETAFAMSQRSQASTDSTNVAGESSNPWDTSS